MRGSWPTRTLADLCGKGVYGLTASANLSPVGPKFLRTTDMINGTIDWQSVPYCEVDSDSAVKKDVRHGDIVISRTGANAGASAFVSEPPPDSVFAGYLVRFRAKPNEADARFLGFMLRSQLWTNYVTNSRTGSAQPQFNAVLMGDFAFPCPPLDEQRRIAVVLGVLDDLIEVNRRLIGDLSELSDVAFESWASDASKFVPLEQAMDRVVDGVDSDALSPEAIYLGLEHFGTDASGLTGRGTVDGLASNKVRFQVGDVLYGKLRPYFRKVARPGFAGVCTTEAWVLRAKKPATQEFVHWVVRRKDFTRMAMAGSEGTRMPRANWSHLSEMEIPDPTNPGLAPVSRLVRTFWEASDSLEQEIVNLQATRDELLPLLMSGRVQVGDVAV